MRRLGIHSSSIGSLSVLVHKVGSPHLHSAGHLHLAPVGFHDSDGTIAVAQEPGNFLAFLQLTHLVEQGSPPWSEGKVDEEIRHVLACATFDSSDHLMEARPRLEVAQSEDEHPRVGVMA